VNPLFAVLGLSIYRLFGAHGRGWRTASLTSAAALSLMFIGYSFIYVMTPLDLKWHLDTSLERLFLHFWPPVVFLTACIGASSGRALQTDTRPERAYAPYAAMLVIGLAVSMIFPADAAETPAPASVTVLEADASRPLVTGRAVLEIPAEGFALLNHRSPEASGNEAVIPVTDAARSGVFPFDMENGLRTSLAISNPGPELSTITLSAGDGSRPQLKVPAGGQIAGFLDETPFNLKFRSGVASLTGSSAFIAAAFLTSEDGAFRMTGIPIADLESIDDGTTNVAIAMHGGGWSTELILVNPVQEIIEGAYRLLDPTGRVLEERRYEIPPNSNLRRKWSGPESDPARGRIEITRSGAAHSPLVWVRLHTGVMLPVTSPALRVNTHSEIFLERTDSISSELVIVNPGAEPTSVVVTLAGIGTRFNLGPHSTIFLPWIHIPGSQFTAKPARIMVDVNAERPVLTGGIRWMAGSARRMVSAVYSASERGTSIPYLAVGSGFQTTFIFPRGGSRLRLFNPLGQPLELSLFGR
jgi:hypothetical protein